MTRHALLETREPSLKELLIILAQYLDDSNYAIAIQNDEVQASVVLIREKLKLLVQGSQSSVWKMNAIIAATGFVAIAGISPLVNSLPDLSASNKNVLVGVPSIVGALMMLVLGSQLEQGSGRNFIIKLRMIALIGILGLIALTVTTKPENMPYWLVLILNGFTGASIASFMLNTNVIMWTPISQSGSALAKYAAIAGIAPSLTLVILQLSKEYLNLPSAFALTLFVSLLGTLLTYFKVYEAPYTQLLQHGFPDRLAKIYARMLGQEKFPIPVTASYPITLYKTAFTFIALTLSAATISSFGVFLLTTTSSYFTLTKILDFSIDKAVYATAGLSFSAMAVRYFVGKPMDKFDKSKGFYTFLLGMLANIIGASMQAINRPKPSLEYILCAQALLAIGIGLSAAAAFKLLVKWSQTLQYPIGIMSAWASFNGQLSGFLLNAIAAGIVSRDEEDKYFNTFWLITALAIAGAGMVILGERHSRNAQIVRQPVAPSMSLNDDPDSEMSDALSFSV